MGWNLDLRINVLAAAVFCICALITCTAEICSDGTTCPGLDVCCMTSTGHFGCCPFPNGTCCQDLVHCCPNGSICDLVNEQCL